MPQPLPRPSRPRGKASPPATRPPKAVAQAEVAFAFQPELKLWTLGRGEGLLGMRPHAPFGPRGAPLTLASIDWVYRGLDGTEWRTPAPLSVLEKRGPALQTLDDGRLLARDFSAEAVAADLLRDSGLQPVDGDALQWRSPDAADAAAFDTARVWSLPQEAQFADFWAEQVPLLQAQGWAIVVGPGFAHESVPVLAWRIRIDPATGQTQGKELAKPLGQRTSAVDSSGLALSARQGSWLMTLGVDIDGESLDLAPMLADLLRRDARWLKAGQLHQIDDAARVILRAPGGRRVEAPGAVLKAIIGRMLDLLAPGQNPQGPLQLSEWDLPRLENLHQDLQQIAATHLAADGLAGTQIAWHAEGAAGLPNLVTRLRREAPVEEIAPPPGLGLTLRPYQLQGVAWLQYLRRHALGGILADEMGLGKTAQTLAHLLIEQQAGRLDLPALILLPASLLFNWVAEAARVAPTLRVLVLHGPRRAADFARIAEHDLVLTTYTLVRRDLARLAEQPWHLLVLDEAQLVKNPASRGARALRRLRARHRLCLTGTPLENHLGELWAQFDFLMPGFLGSARHFWQVWRKPIEVNGESVRAEILAQRVRPFMLRRRKQDVATDLPPRVDIVRRVRLEGAQRELYESVRAAADTQVRRVLAKSGLPGAQIQVLDALLRLRQVCCDPALVPGNTGVPPHRAKLELLQDLLPSLVAEGRRVLVFSQFVEMLALVSRLLNALGLPHLMLTGDVPPVDRAALVQQFQASDAPGAPNIPVMLVSLKAGGLGLNLTAADAVVLIDPWWNPAVEEQAAARAHRIGQQRTVFVYRVLVEGSIEERMLELQARKSLLAEGILGHDLGGALKFSAEELQGLLAPLR